MGLKELWLCKDNSAASPDCERQSGEWMSWRKKDWWIRVKVMAEGQRAGEVMPSHDHLYLSTLPIGYGDLIYRLWWPDRQIDRLALSSSKRSNGRSPESKSALARGSIC